jgi:hypothetical protein
MVRKAIAAMLCSIAIMGQIRAQEVTVARETKPSAAHSATPASDSEKATAKTAPVRKEKSDAALPTVEEMRMAGALAGEGLKNQVRPEKTAVSRKPKPDVAKKQRVPGESLRNEKPLEQASTPRDSKAAPKKSRAVGRPGAVRPSMIESEKQEPDSSQPAKSEPRGGQTNAPQSTNRSHSQDRSAHERDTASAQWIRLPMVTALT